MKTLIEKTSDKLVNAFLKNKIIDPIPSKFSKKLNEAQKLRKLCESKIKEPVIGYKAAGTGIPLLKKFKEKYNLPFSFLSDSKKEVAKSFGANGLFTPKRMTFVINENGKIEKIYKKVNINTHAETILKDLTS